MDLSLDEIRREVPPAAEYAVSQGEYERIIGEIDRKPESELREQLDDLRELDAASKRTKMEIDLLEAVLEDGSDE